ncbi:MAG: hypothetical protein NVSMB5_19460 [Candidatus Velthaea sp.]
MVKPVLRRLLSLAVGSRPVRDWFIRLYDGRSPHAGWGREHPIDIQYGIRTSGSLPGFVLQAGSAAAKTKTAYAGSQPSIIRRALALVLVPERTVLLDLGCGKGRVLAVASELPFRAVIGIELSATVARMAEANMQIVRRNFPGRPPITVVAGDAVEYPFPASPLAIFLYNPFGEAPIARLRARIEEALETSDRPITVVYYNPVWGAVFDASPRLCRAHAVSFPYDESEIGFGPDSGDTVVIWTDRVHSSGAVSAEAARPIVVTVPDWRAELV